MNEEIEDLIFALCHLSKQDPDALQEQLSSLRPEKQLEILNKLLHSWKNWSLLAKRIGSLENFYSTEYFMETLTRSQKEFSIHDTSLAKVVGRNKTTLDNWKLGRLAPSSEDRTAMLKFMAQQAQISTKWSVWPADHLQSLRDYDAILKRAQDLEGDVNPAEPASGGSGD